MHEALIRADEVTHHYGRKRALDAVSLEMQSGQVTALPGPNGAEKSTLRHLLLGLLPVQAGRIEVLGRQPKQVMSVLESAAESREAKRGIEDNRYGNRYGNRYRHETKGLPLRRLGGIVLSVRRRSPATTKPG